MITTLCVRHRFSRLVYASSSQCTSYRSYLALGLADQFAFRTACFSSLAGSPPLMPRCISPVSLSVPTEAVYTCSDTTTRSCCDRTSVNRPSFYDLRRCEVDYSEHASEAVYNKQIFGVSNTPANLLDHLSPSPLFPRSFASFLARWHLSWCRLDQ